MKTFPSIQRAHHAEYFDTELASATPRKTKTYSFGC